MVGAVSGKTFKVYNPATGVVTANVPKADKADLIERDLEELAEQGPCFTVSQNVSHLVL